MIAVLFKSVGLVALLVMRIISNKKCIMTKGKGLEADLSFPL